MKRLLVVAINAAFFLLGMAGCTGGADTNLVRQSATVQAAASDGAAKTAEPKKKAMRAFESEQELKTYLRELSEKQKSLRRSQYSDYDMAAPSAAPANA